MHWLLTFWLTLPTGEVRAIPAGMMAGQATCMLAGATMGRALAAAAPGVRVSWTCEDRGGAGA